MKPCESRLRRGRPARWWLGLALAALTLGPGRFARADCLPDAPIDSSRSVLAIAGSDGSLGSGVVVAPNRLLTVAHAVRGGAHLSVEIDGEAQTAHTLSFDLAHDLALLGVDTGDRPPLRLIERELRDGEKIWVAGHRVGDHERAGAQQLAFGQVIGPWRDAIRVSALVEAGQSGGALFACDGDQVWLGGTLSGFGAVADEQGLSVRLPDFSLAVPVAALRDFLASNGVAPPMRAALKEKNP